MERNGGGVTPGGTFERWVLVYGVLAWHSGFCFQSARTTPAARPPAPLVHGLLPARVVSGAAGDGWGGRDGATGLRGEGDP